MKIPVLGFISPIIGVEGEFNTFRMGRKYSTLEIHSDVFLMDEKQKVIFGSAEVLEVTLGKVGELCVLYGAQNHTELENEVENHAESLYRTLLKIYGPHILTPTKLFTVVRLRRMI